MRIDATYSPEDDKLRLYASSRLDPETFERVKAAGFRWAPRQELFVAPKWTPEREDLAAELAGEIEAEEMTLAERAEAKAERLDALARKRHREANAYSRRAAEIGERFAMGQPILVGHHSEGKARRDQKKMHAAADKASKAHSAANYWLYRATGVERFANMKNSSRTRAGRIATLLAELRDLQRAINDAHKALAIWEKCDTPARIAYAIGQMDSRKTLTTFGDYTAHEKGEKTGEQIRADCIARAQVRIDGPTRRRWIEHTLNRLSFERSQLGEVARFAGELSPVILQAFARTHGAEKPAARKTEAGTWALSSPVPLPLHIADGDTIELTAVEWCDLMHSTGYEVPEAKERRTSSKPTPPPLINPTRAEAEALQALWNSQARNSDKPSTIHAMTQATYSRNSGGSYSPFSTVEIDATGAAVRHGWRGGQWLASAPGVARVRVSNHGSALYAAGRVVHIEDKPTKALPLTLQLAPNAQGVLV